jgi:cell wall-associated NlpC family hydrolase
MPAASTTTEVAAGARSSAELKRELKQRKLSEKIANGDKVELDQSQNAVAPIGAPDEVQQVIIAANAINKYPYIWGGGHGSFQARGYDCSGSVSYALKGANLINEPMVSGRYEKYGDAGKGKWITIYANGGHMFMIVGGVRYDTSFRDGPYGSRWQTGKRSMSGFVVRHPPGL